MNKAEVKGVGYGGDGSRGHELETNRADLERYVI